ncbi:UNVERIFIED_CONTAM: hypothetical protein Sangu_2604200 [Sesamum angustifolium]|uniref:Retrotransposon Copia-like N-terminal domain-containing protein n=1 Tax=Sesamum angustifolium TaxID=2727405 RepID=A0AAW2J5C5_9LAMI
MAEPSIAAETRQTTTIPKRLQLHESNHPRMVLVSAPLTGNDYLNWNFGVKRALRVKMKLGFIDGTSITPSANDPHFKQWIRVESMVTTWILNSISKDTVEAFMYTKSSRNLWLDLEQRYGVQWATIVSTTEENMFTDIRNCISILILYKHEEALGRNGRTKANTTMHL